MTRTIDDDLHDVRIAVIGGLDDRTAQRRHDGACVVDERLQRLGDHLRLDQWKVALDVDDDVARQLGRDFGDTVRAGLVVASCHPYDAAKSLHRGCDAIIVGRDDHGVDAARSCRATIDVLDHRLSGNVGQRLSREACRLVAGGDDGDDSGWL
jgi:hypothetical protein